MHFDCNNGLVLELNWEAIIQLNHSGQNNVRASLNTKEQPIYVLSSQQQLASAVEWRAT